MRSAICVLFLAVTAPASAQTECDAAALTTLAASITTADVRVPRPPRIEPNRCMSVGPPSLELGPPVVGTFAGSCPVVAMLYRWTTIPTETCGYDVHFDPEVVTGIVVVRRSGGRWRRVATSVLTAPALDALSATDITGDGSADLVLAGNVLVIEGRRIVFLDP